MIARMHVFSQTTESVSSSLWPPSLLDVPGQHHLFKDTPERLQFYFRRILHHFMINTSATISPNETKIMWTEVFPRFAITHELVNPGVKISVLP